MHPALQLEPRGEVTVMRMAFGRANALGPEVVEALCSGLDEVGTGPLVLTGTGRTFSAGLDLVSLDALGREALEQFVERFSALMVQLLTARHPVVAAVNGHAVAGGCVLALACDYRVGTAGDFRIGLNELALGLTLPSVAMEIPRGVLTPAAHRRVVLGAELVGPQQALELGLLDELAADPDRAVERACEVARERGRAAAAYASVKGNVVAPIVESIGARRRATERRFVDSWFSEEARQARCRAIEQLKGRRG